MALGNLSSHEKVREFRVTGPPGCGKTHFITRQCERAASIYGGSKVVVSSLTRAAASVAAGAVKNVIPRENIGTLHALAYRAVGAGAKVAEAELKDWNTWMEELKKPWYRLSIEAPDPDEDISDPLSEQTEGDGLMTEMNKLRARMIPRGKWDARILPFADLWQHFKDEGGLIDFTDMLEVALTGVDTAPGDPAAMLLDESQDLSRLAWALARKWGEQCITFITVGDPDQLLYHWAGVDVDAFSAVPLPDDQTRVLKQSYRVPRAVHALALQWIARTPHRIPVEYHPTDVEGSVRRLDATVRCPDDAIDDARRKIGEGKSVLFAVTCSYHLQSIIACLRNEGIPFHNPYRVKRGDWNPLRPSRGISAAQRVLALARGSVNNENGAPWWTVRDLFAIVDKLESAHALNHGAKTMVKEWADDDPERQISGNDLAAVFQEQALDAFLDRDLRFLVNATLSRHRQGLYFPVRVAQKFGTIALEEEPRVIVSTIHGCKGGEADVVYLFPDLSPRAAEEWDEPDGSEGKEGIRRAFYVGITRAREELVICEPFSPLAVSLN
jgi:superfamily I DNA/RNA helicase